MEKVFFEELEEMKELGAIADFAEAAAPWVFGGITIALAVAT
jgi:hypothetical protein